MKHKVWLLLAVAALVLNGLGLWRALVLYERSLQSRELADPQLIEMPADNAVMSGKNPLHWRWDQPVVADAMVGLAPESAPVSFTPGLSGDFVWVNDRTLQFTPEQPWVAGQVFVVDLDTTVTNLLGRVSLTRHHCRVQGPALQFLESRLMHVEGNHSLEVSLRFNQAVHPDDVRRHLRVTDRAGEEVSVRLRETPVVGEVFAAAEVGKGAPLRFTLSSGLPSVNGPRGALESEHIFSVDLPSRFHLVGMEAQMPTFDPGSVRLRFNSAPDMASLRNQLQIEPEVQVSIGGSAWYRRDQVHVTGDFQPGQRYTVRLGAGVRGTNRRSLDEAIEHTLFFPQRSPGLRFSHGGEILNAAGSRQVAVSVVNEGKLTMSMQRVQDQNLVALLMRRAGEDHYGARHRPDHSLAVPVWEDEMEMSGSGEVVLDLADPLAALGQGVYRLQVTGRDSKRTIDRLIISGELGLLTRGQREDFLVWVVGLGDGQPVADATVQVWSSTRELLGEGRSDEDGLVQLKIPEREGMKPMAVVARKQESLGVLSLENNRELPATNTGRAYLQAGHEAFVYTDRGMYRPGETMHFRAIVRDIDFWLPGEFPVQVTLRGPDQLIRHREIVSLNDLGTVAGSVVLNDDWPNGSYGLTISLPGDDSPELGRTQVNLESFVPPQVVVEATTPQGGGHLPPVFLLNTIARMLYGGAAADHEVEVTLSVTPETFQSAEFPRHTFLDLRKQGFSHFTRTIGKSRTSEAGKAEFRIEIPDDLEGPSALRAMVGVSVREFSGRPATAYVSRRIDRHPHYLGLQARPGDDREVELDVVLVAAASGLAVSENREVTIVLSRVDWTWGYRQDSNSRWSYFSERVSHEERRETVRLDNGRGVFSLRPPANGRWEFAVESPDTQSSSVELAIGGGFGSPARANRVAMSLDRKKYSPGEVAMLELNAPFAGIGLLTVETDRIWSHQVVAVPEGDHRLPVEVPNPGAGNVWVRLSMVRPLPDRGESPVILAEGALPLRLQMANRHLPISIEVAEQLRPGEAVEIILRGEPGAEVVLAGVDEGILLLNDFSTPNPFAFFTSLRRYGGRQWDVFDLLMPELGELFHSGDPAMGGGAAMLRNRLNPVDAKRFNPLAWWSGVHRFSESGELVLSMQMPEFAGEVRWMAVQAGRSGVGSGESRSQVGRGVVTQQSLPLFLAPGDETEWLVRLHNRSDAAAAMGMQFDIQGPVTAIAADPQAFELAAGEARVLRRRVRADEDAGVARFQVRFAQGDEVWTDEIEMAVRPVHPYRVREQYVVLQPGEQLQLRPEDEVFDFGASRSLRVSALPALELSGAAGYLLRYPYGCLEQTVSAGMPALFVPELVGDHLQLGAADIIRETVQRIWLLQTRHGGFGFWSGSTTPDFGGTLHALDFLLESRARGHEVDAARLQLALDWVRGELNRGRWSLQDHDANNRIPAAARILALSGQLDMGWLQRLRERRDDLHARGRLRAAEAMIAMGERPLATEMLHGLRAVPASGGLWYSDTSLNAELLRVLLRLNPTDRRIPGLAERVMGARRNGRWWHTYENAAALRALAAYHAAFGGEQAAVDMRWADGSGLAEDAPLELALDFTGTLHNHSAAPVYVRESVGGVSRVPVAVDNAFGIEQRLLSTDGQPLNGPLASGTNVLLHVRLTGLQMPVEHLAMDMRLPAGLEPLPLGLHRRMHEVVEVQGVRNQFSGAHLELRDDRILLFPPVLRERTAEWYFLLRAVTPGTFTFPAAYGQAMYDPTFEARGQDGRLEVLP